MSTTLAGKAVIPVPVPTTAVGPSVYWITGVQGTWGGMVTNPDPVENDVCVGLLADCSSSQRSFWSRLDDASSSCARADADFVVSIHGHWGGAWALADPATAESASVTPSANSRHRCRLGM